jgi:hypothetical protein
MTKHGEIGRLSHEVLKTIRAHVLREYGIEPLLTVTEMPATDVNAALLIEVNAFEAGTYTVTIQRGLPERMKS